MNNRIILIAAFFVAFSTIANASSSLLTSYSTFQNWTPILMLAILISIFIVAMIYFAGSVLNNSKVKARAVEELNQVIGVIIIAVIVIAVITFFGSASVTSIAANSIGNNVQNMCNQLMNNPLNLVNNNKINIDVGGISYSTFTPTNTICTEVNDVYTSISSGNGLSDITGYADYDLMASYVITANLTSQMAQNLEGFYQYEDMIGFLSTLTPVTTFCVADEATPLTGWLCIIPFNPRLTSISLSYTPYAGYAMLKSITKPVEVEAYLAFDVYLIELLIILTFLFAWPYLLAAGIILKSSIYTRRAGGTLIAIVIAALIIFPIIFLMEYASLNGGGANLIPIGANSNSIPILSMPGKNINTGAQVVYNSNDINFYVFPNVSNVINYYGCWPFGGLYVEELKDSAFFAIPAAGAIDFIFGFIGGIVGSLPYMPTACTQDNALALVFHLTDLYGIIGVTGYILPVLNILILITAIKGLSSLLGGDTNLAGLGNLV
ncbi:MAG: hypothetical protein ACP5RF_01890 [Candidatus Micrarchaeia archaeon]